MGSVRPRLSDAVCGHAAQAPDPPGGGRGVRETPKHPEIFR